MSQPLGGDTIPDARETAHWARGGLTAWRALGPATQAVVPGVYAWAVTIAPVGWSRGASVVAGAAVAVGIASLVAGPLAERRWPTVARMVIGWGLVSSALATWAVSPEAAVDSFDATRGIAGMLGWSLFAFAIASPARQATVAVARAAVPSRHRASTALNRAVLAVGIGLAVALEVPGWRIEQRDRALLLRLVALAGGLGLVSAASAIVVGRHASPARARGPRPRSRRLQPAGALWLAVACVLIGAGATYELWRHLL